MAFFYSDKNFTVIGNLCFVHIIIDDDTGRIINIPPAIGERMLFSSIVCTYPCVSTTTREIGYALINNREISLSNLGKGYLYCYFPIDSNK